MHRARIRKNYFKLLEKGGESVPEKKSKTAAAPIVTYQDRINKTKQRRLDKRKSQFEEATQRVEEIDRKKQERQKRKDRFSQKTQRGQPLMGPRISGLLEKIQEDKKK